MNKFFLFEVTKRKYAVRVIDPDKIKKAYEDNFFTGEFELSEEGRKFIEEYLTGLTYEELSQKFNFSKQRVGQILKKLDKLIPVLA